jgi:hypothetical protein
LAQAGLEKMRYGTTMAYVVGIDMLLISALTTKELLNGTRIVIITVISKTKKLLEISAGNKVR